MTDIVDKAILRIKEAATMSESIYNKPLLILDSGGKDSSVCKKLAEISGINYEVTHSHTTADAPETVYFVREEFKRLESNGIKCNLNLPVFKGKRVSMWSLIPQKLLPPTRMVRYCCDVLKENSGNNRFAVTGVRWSESARRKNTRGIYENVNKKIILTNDNDDKRMLFENCRIKASRLCNPIVDWTDNDVWQFLKSEKVNVNPLYDMGFNRVGCIGCPLAGKHRIEEFRIYPKYKDAYIRAFDRMIQERIRRGKSFKDWRMGKNGIDVFHWWMEDGVIPGQIEMQELLENENQK